MAKTSQPTANEAPVAEIAPPSITGEIEPITPSMSQTHPNLAFMLQSQKLEAEFAANNNRSDSFVYDLMEKILAAQTAEEIFAAQDSGMVSGKDFAGRAFYLKADDITIVQSTITEGEGLPFYAVLKVTEISTGEEYVLNCGGKTFMAVLEGLRKIDYFDVTEETPNGAALVIIATPSPKGAYLSLKPFKMAPVQRGGKK